MARSVIVGILGLFTVFAPAYSIAQGWAENDGVVLQKYIDRSDPLWAWIGDLQNNSASVSELKLSEKQVKEFATASKSRKEFFQQISPSDFASDKDKQKFNKLLTRRMIDDVCRILSPHQMETLDRLILADAKQQLGTVGLLSMNWFRERVGISEEAFQQLKRPIEEEQAKLDEIIANARTQAKVNVLNHLTDEQREKIKKLFVNGSR